MKTIESNSKQRGRKKSHSNEILKYNEHIKTGPGNDREKNPCTLYIFIQTNSKQTRCHWNVSEMELAFRSKQIELWSSIFPMPLMCLQWFIGGLPPFDVPMISRPEQMEIRCLCWRHFQLHSILEIYCANTCRTHLNTNINCDVHRNLSTNYWYNFLIDDFCL